MKIKKAIITASGKSEHLYPTADSFQRSMIPLVDSDGETKPVIQIIAEQALNAGITDINLVCSADDKKKYLKAFNTLLSVKDEKESQKLEKLLSSLTFTVQPSPKGYADALYRAKEFAGSDHFLLLLSDHLYISNNKNKNCAAQLIELAEQEKCSVSAVNPTREHLVRHYGTLTGEYINSIDAYKITRIMEKPSATTAETELQTLGMRNGYYLCFFGMHVLTSNIFDIIEKTKKSNSFITPALQILADNSKYFAKNINGNRYNIGIKYGLLNAQIALALSGIERDEALYLLSDTLIKDKLK